MNIPKVILINTLNEILNNDRLSEDSKNIIQEVFSSDNQEEINNFVLKNIVAFSSTSLLKYIIDEDVVVSRILDLMLNDNEGYTISIVMQRINDLGIQESFLTNENTYNTLVNNPNLLESLSHKVDNLFDLYPKDKKDTLLQLFKNKADFSIRDLDALPADEQIIMLDDSSVRQHMYQEFLHSYFGNISRDTCINIWNTFKDDFAQESLTNRLNVFSKLEDDLKPEAITHLKIDEEIDNISSYNFETIAPYISQETLSNKAFNSNTGKLEDKYLKSLNSENQLKLIRDLLISKANILNNMVFDNLNLDVRVALFDDFANRLLPDTIYNLYKETNNIEYLKVLKTQVLARTDITMSDFLCEDDFISLLNEEEKQTIVEKIRCTKYMYIPNRSLINYNPEIFNKYINKTIERLENNELQQVGISFKDYMQYLSSEQQDQIVSYVMIEDWLSSLLSNKDVFDYIADLLKKNPTIFKGKDFSKVNMSYFLDEELIERIDEIFDYFEENQLVIFFGDKVLETNDKLKELFKKKALLNPSLITSTFKLNCFTKEEQDMLLNKMELNALASLITGLRFDNIDITHILLNRYDEIIEFTNNNRGVATALTESLYAVLDDKKKEDFISKINNLYALNHLFSMSSIEASRKDKEIILSRQLEIYNQDYYNLCVSDDFIFMGRLELDNFSSKDLDLFINTADMRMLIYVSTYYYNKNVINKIVENVKSDITSLLSEDISPILNNFIFKLEETNRNEIERVLDTTINNNEFYNNYVKGRVKDFNIKEKIKFLSLFHNKEISKEKQELFLQLLDRNPYLFSTIESFLLDDNMINMGFHFIDKTSKYPVLENKLKIALVRKPELAPFLTQVSSYLQKSEVSEAAYDRKISMIIEYLSHSENKLTDYDFSSINPDNISDVIEYILHNYTTIEFNIRSKADNVISDHIEDLYEFSIDNFTEERLKKCDELFNSADDINVMKNIYFNKYLSMSLEDASNFYKSYIINYDKVRHFADSEIPDKFIALITKIMNISDPVTLRELYNSTDITYDIGDRFTIESIIAKAYYTSLTNDYVNKQNGSLVTKQIKDKNGNVIDVNLTELFDNFGIFVHSTCAYGEMPLLDNDYFVSWNNNPRTDNHGICCSYITNSSYGTAAVENTGVMFGFTNINENSVATYSPYDLATRNDGYTITSYHVPFFTTLDDIPNYTRHTHNEFDLERRNYSMSQEHSCVQPDCIIILEDMSDDIKANSLKAYEDFKNHGIELKLIYIDRVKVAQNEASKLNRMLQEYSLSHDMHTLANIINLYESNICGCDFLTAINMDEVFMTDTVRSTLSESVEYIANLSDVNLRNKLIVEFIGVLEHEQSKFDLLDDFNKKRAHTFKLYDSELKQQVEYLRSLYSNGLEKEMVV